MAKMIKRRYGESPTLETRAEAHETISKQRRCRQIIECLMWADDVGLEGMTAKECAVAMYNRGYIPTTERNFTAPRLTELSEEGIVEPVGKKKCDFTGKTVTVWSLVDKYETHDTVTANH